MVAATVPPIKVRYQPRGVQPAVPVSSSDHRLESRCIASTWQKAHDTQVHQRSRSDPERVPRVKCCVSVAAEIGSVHQSAGASNPVAALIVGSKSIPAQHGSAKSANLGNKYQLQASMTQNPFTS
eukprot:6207972-Pleurochrysis_carterae.AAC.2